MAYKLDAEEVARLEIISVQREIDFDLWEYFHDEDSGVGIVVNYFRDEVDPEVNVYVVPKSKVANNDWHNDMIDITLTSSDNWKGSSP